MRSYIASFLLLSALVFSQYSSAVDYYWAARSLSGQFATPVLACSAYVGANTSRPTWGFLGFTSTSTATRKYCLFSRPDSSGGTLLYPNGYASESLYYATLTGDSCPSGSVYNPLTFQCEGDPCLSTVGSEIGHMHKLGEIGPSGFSPGPTAPDAVCSGSCRYVSPAPLGNAYRFSGGSPSGVFQNYSYRGDGITCTGSESATSVPSPSNKPTSDSSNNCTQKTTDAEGRIHFTCQTSNEYRDPGSMSCGTANGAVVCVPKSPTPTLTKKDSTIETTESTNPDGSKTTNTTTTTTITSCTGMNSCTTSTTVVNGSKGTNADGSAGDSSSSCSGDNCSTTGSGDQATEEEQEEQEEECDPTTDPDKCGQSSVSGESCDTSVACSGDAVQCAILRSQKAATCADETERDYDKVKAQIEAKAAGPGFQVEKETFDFSTQFSPGTRFLPAACPAPRSMHISSFNRTYQLKYDPICDFASTISSIVVAMAGLFFAIYVGRSFGGS